MLPANIAIDLFSSAALSHSQCLLQFPADRITNATVTALLPGMAGVSLLEQNPGTYLLSLTAMSGQTLQGTQHLARLNFASITNQTSAFVPHGAVDYSAQTLRECPDMVRTPPGPARTAKNGARTARTLTSDRPFRQTVKVPKYLYLSSSLLYRRRQSAQIRNSDDTIDRQPQPVPNLIAARMPR